MKLLDFSARTMDNFLQIHPAQKEPLMKLFLLFLFWSVSLLVGFCLLLFYVLLLLLFVLGKGGSSYATFSTVNKIVLHVKQQVIC